MSSSDLDQHGIWVVQLKTKAKLLIPVHPALRAALAACCTTDGTLLKTGFNEPFTVARYTKAAEQRTLARAAIDRLARRQDEVEL